MSKLRDPFESPEELELELELEASPLGDYLAGTSGPQSPRSLQCSPADAETSFDSIDEPTPTTPERYNEATITARRRRRGARVGGSNSRSGSASPAPAALRVATRHKLDATGAGPGRGPGRAEPPPAPGTSPESDAFAERFKYLIATSGLLEKTLLDRTRGEEEESGASGGGGVGVGVGAGIVHNVNPASGSAGCRTAPLVQESAMRLPEVGWDVLACVAVVVLGLTYILGPAIVAPLAAVAAGLACYWTRPREAAPAEPTEQIPPTEEAEEREVDLVPEAETEPQPEMAREPPTPSRPDSPDPNPVLATLQTLLADSNSLDKAMTSSLQILSTHPDDTNHAPDLRITVNRVLEDLADSLATCYSTLIPMADRAELAVLGEMYNIPVLGPRRPRRCDTEGCDEARSPVSSISGDDVVTALAPSLFDPNDRFTKLPERPLRQKRSGFASNDWAPPSAFRAPVERGVDEDSRSDGVMSQGSDSSGPASSGPASLPDRPISPPRTSFVPKHTSPLSQTLERLEGGFPRPLSPPFSAAAANTLHVRTQSHSSIRYFPSTPTSTSEAASTLALARASANLSSANRRSLQMPLNPHNLDALNAALAGSPSLHRANSLPQRGGLRRLKIASASGQSNGSESSASEMSPPQNGRVLDRESPTPGNKRASVLFPEDHAPGMGMGIGIGLAPYHLPRPLRVPSVSPLTLGGLRAAYLGVHLKRRRVACCLLGLALEADEQYWAKVCDTLRALSAALSAACARLSGVRADAEKEALAARALSNAAASPVASPSTAVPAASLGAFPGDFVPPDRSAAAVLANMDELQRALARVWTRCEEMRASVSAGEDVDVLEAWAAVRADIGGMLRNVERGRELAQRDEVIVEDDDDTPEADEMARAVTSSPLPEFMRAWGPGPAELSEGEVEVEDVSMRELAEDAEDVQIGADEVFEADIPAASATLRAPSILSREERIALSREARERGLTLAQLTKVREDPEAAERERERAANLERQRATSEMMCELEGMFGEIRRRKGMPGE